MQLDEAIVSQIVMWAMSKPIVRRAWLFGSRAKGKALADSDIDIALDLGPDEEAAAKAWFSNASNWRQELRRMATGGLKIDLQAAFKDDEIVLPAVKSHGVLIFERESEISK